MAWGAAPLPPFGLAIDETWPAGLFAVNGQAATLLYHRTLPAAYGTFTLTGQDATLTEGGAITSVNAAPIPPLSFLTFGATGQTVLPCEFGTFTLSGQAATLAKGKRLECEAGSFIVSGAPALRDMQITAERGSFVEFGLDAQLAIEPRTVTAGYGAFTVTGFDASLTYEPVGNRVLTCEAGMFYMSRSDQLALTSITMTATRVLTCDFGAFTLTGQSATLTGPKWQDVEEESGSWVYVTPGGGVWTDVDPDS